MTSTVTAARGIAPADRAPRWSGLFRAQTWHTRRGPVDHAFRYRLWTWLLDLDELEDLDANLALFAVDRPAPFSLRADDHVIIDPGAGWKRSVLDWLARHDVALQGGRVALQTTPRVLGYGFNPLSLWWCWDEADRLVAVIAEVHNTYGGRHAYLLRPDADGRASQPKALYVSPFYDVSGTYRMHLTPPGDRFAVHIGYDRDGRRAFDATWTGRRQPLTSRSLARLLITTPWLTLRIITLIHLQGIRLWLRGLKVAPGQRRPEITTR